MIYRKRSKLLFPVGFIGLVVFSFFGFRRIAEVYQERTAPFHTIELNFPDSDTAYTGKKFREMRKFHSFFLTTNSLQNDAILNETKELINKIKVNRDTFHGVHIVFNDSTPYRDYIKAVNYSMEKWPGMFASYHNDFWSWYGRYDTTDTPKEVLERWRKKYGELY